jgi:hypothetical protein
MYLKYSSLYNQLLTKYKKWLWLEE